MLAGNLAHGCSSWCRWAFAAGRPVATTTGGDLAATWIAHFRQLDHQPAIAHRLLGADAETSLVGSAPGRRRPRMRGRANIEAILGGNFKRALSAIWVR